MSCCGQCKETNSTKRYKYRNYDKTCKPSKELVQRISAILDDIDHETLLIEDCLCNIREFEGEIMDLIDG